MIEIDCWSTKKNLVLMSTTILNIQAWVVQFEKPKGDPSAFLKPATTVLSPYLKVRISFQNLVLILLFSLLVYLLFLIILYF